MNDFRDHKSQARADGMFAALPPLHPPMSPPKKTNFSSPSPCTCCFSLHRRCFCVTSAAKIKVMITAAAGYVCLCRCLCVLAGLPQATPTSSLRRSISSPRWSPGATWRAEWWSAWLAGTPCPHKSQDLQWSLTSQLLRLCLLLVWQQLFFCWVSVSWTSCYKPLQVFYKGTSRSPADTYL